jgi:hypothetical protein
MREAKARWAAANPDKIRAKLARQYHANPERYRDRAVRWAAENREKVSAQRIRRKLEALEAYGGRRCAKCGCEPTDLGGLHLDHVDSDGPEHRREITGDPRGTGTSFYVALRRLNWPTDPPLQVLCRDCHQEKTNWEQETQAA